MRGAIAMAMSSWKSSLQAYGICTCASKACSVFCKSRLHTVLMQKQQLLQRIENTALCASQTARAFERFYAGSDGHSKHLYDACGVFACCAMELVLLQISNCKEPAALAHMHSVGITLVKQALLHRGQILSLAGSLLGAAGLGYTRTYTVASVLRLQ